MSPPPSPTAPARNWRLVFAGLGIATMALVLLTVPIRISWKPVADAAVVVEFHHPAAVSTARVRLSAADASVTLREQQGSAIRRPENGRIVVEVDGRPEHYLVTVPRSLTRFELQVSDRTVFRKSGAEITTIWPMAPDSTWLVPLTP